MDTFYERAYSLISSPKAREAFNIDAEPDAIRDEYGRNPAGQRMLMARRLVAAGVRFVASQYGGWDMHTEIARRHEEPDARLRPGVRRPDPRPRPQRPARPHARHGLQRVRPHAEDQQGRRPRPLAEGLQRRPGRRRRQEGLHPRRLQRHGHRARARPDRPRGPGHHRLPPARHRRRQGADGPRQPPDRDRRRRQGPQGAARPEPSRRTIGAVARTSAGLVAIVSAGAIGRWP